MSVYVVATATVPEIVCPSWCTTPKAVHLERLGDNDGMVCHDSAFVDGYSHTVTTFVDGTPVPGDVALVFAEEGRMLDGATVDDAETFARQILRAVEEARA